jgi:hypothetical protein
MNAWHIGCYATDGTDPRQGPMVGTMYDMIHIIPEPLLADEVVNLIKEIKERWENANDPGGSYGATLCQQILETPTIRKFEEMRRHSIHWFENTLNRVRNEFSSTFPPLPATR